MSKVGWFAAGAAAGATVVALGFRRPRRPAWPAGRSAVGATEASDVARTLLTLPALRRTDLAIPFAPSVATSVEPLLHGHRYFPRMLDDIAAATDHIHLLIYGYKPGDIGTTFRDALAARVRDGVAVRLEVDAIGSEIDFSSRRLFRELVAAGVDVAAHDGLAIVRSGQLGARRADLRLEDTLHFDHRKMAVIDGRVGWIGGSGIEDHYNDERFYDVMCRVEGPVVAQLQLVFLASWRHKGASLPDVDGSIERWFPETTAAPASDAAVDGVPATILWNVPGTGHHPISDAIEQLLAGAQDRVDIVNPYISNRAILAGLLAAAQRGVRVRLIAPGKPTPPYPAAAFRHHYARLLDAGAEILLHPEMAHAKVVRVDDAVLIGGCNLDDLSLFRNDELNILLEGRQAVDATERAVFDELAAMSVPATLVADSRERAWNAAMDRISRLL